MSYFSTLKSDLNDSDTFKYKKNLSIAKIFQHLEVVRTMVDYAAAIKKPFQDTQTLIIGFIIGFIPFISLLVTGYAMGMARNILNGDNKLPKWDPGQFVQYIKDIVFRIIISIVYMIPAGILFLIGGAALIGTIISAMASGNSSAIASELVGGIAAGGIFLLLGGLLAIIGGLFAIMGVFFYLKEGNLGAAFQFSAILKKILTGTFWVTLVIMAIYSVVLLILFGLLSIIPFIGTIIGAGLFTFLSTVTGHTMFAQVFQETP